MPRASRNVSFPLLSPLYSDPHPHSSWGYVHRHLCVSPRTNAARSIQTFKRPTSTRHLAIIVIAKNGLCESTLTRHRSINSTARGNGEENEITKRKEREKERKWNYFRAKETGPVCFHLVPIRDFRSNRSEVSQSVRRFDDAIASTNDRNVIINVFYEILGRFTNQLDYGRTIKTP